MFATSYTEQDGSISPRAKAIGNYVRTIHNRNKQNYAYDYAMHMLHGAAVQPEPERDSYQPLSFMAAQAVRIHIAGLISAYEGPAAGSLTRPV